MNRIILGTSALGSTVSQPEAIKILQTAYESGFRSFDTAPLYGAGYAPGLLSKHLPDDVTISTKFGSASEPLAKFLLKRIVRSRNIQDLLTRLPERYSNHVRETAEWWSCVNQQKFVKAAVAQLNGKKIDYVFLHSPPVLPAKNEISKLDVLVHSLGAAIGVCSPRLSDLRTVIANSEGFSCIQLHLDTFLALDGDEVQALMTRRVWVHGIYSPSATAPSKTISDRESRCIELASTFPSIRFVIGCKSVGGLGRVIRFSERLA